MAQDPNISVGVNADKVFSSVNKIVKALKRVAKTHGLVFDEVIKLDKENKNLAGSYKKIDKAGRKVTRGFTIALDQIKNLGVEAGLTAKVLDGEVKSINLNTKAIKKNAKANRQAAKAKKAAAKARQERGQAKGAITKQIKKLDIPRVGGSIGEKLRVEDSKQALRDFVKTAKISASQVNEVFKATAQGGVGQFQGSLVKLQKLVVDLRTKVGALGNENEKAFQKQVTRATKQVKAEVKALAKAEKAALEKIRAVEKANDAAFQKSIKLHNQETKAAIKAANQRAAALEKANDKVFAKFAKLQAKKIALRRKEEAAAIKAGLAEETAREKRVQKAVKQIRKQQAAELKKAQVAVEAQIRADQKAFKASIKLHNQRIGATQKEAAARHKLFAASVKQANKEAAALSAAHAKSRAAIDERLQKAMRLRAEMQRRLRIQKQLTQTFDTRTRTRQQTGGRRPSTTGERATLTRAEDALRRLVATTKLAKGQINKVFADVSKGHIKRYQGELARVQSAVLKVVAAEKRLGKTAQEAHLKAAKAAAKSKKQLDDTETSASKLLDKFKSYANIAGISLAISALYRLQQAIIDGTTAAVDFSKSIGEIRTIDTANVSTGAWTASLRKLSDSFGIPIVDQAEAAYQALSNQVVTGADSAAFLEAANRLAITAVTDTSTAVNVLTSVLNAYRIPASQAQDVSAKLFKTVELGRVRIDEMSSSLGRIAVPAARIGIRFEELFASISLLTRQGVKFNEAATFIRGIVQKLVKPTKRMSELFRELGVNSSEAAIATFGFGGFMAELEKRTKGSSTEISSFFSRIRASTGALIFAGKGLRDFGKDLSKIDATGIKDFAKTTGIVTETVGKRFEIEFNKIANFFKVDIGQAAITAVVAFSDSLEGGLGQSVIDVGKNILAFGKAFKDAITVNLKDALPLLPEFTKHINLLNVALLGLATKGLFAAAGGITTLFKGLVKAGVAVSAASKIIFAGAAAGGLTLASIFSKVGLAIKGVSAAIIASPFGALIAILAAAAAAAAITQYALDADTRALEGLNKRLAEGTAKIKSLSKAFEESSFRDMVKHFTEGGKAFRKFLASQSAALFKFHNTRIKNLKEVSEVSKQVNARQLKDQRRVASEAKKQLDKIKKDVEATAEDVSKAFKAAGKNLFEFDITVSADKAQLRLIENQILTLQARQQEAAESGDKKTFDASSARISELSRQRFTVSQRLSKAERAADADVSKAKVALLKARSKEEIKAAVAVLKTAKSTRKSVGNTGAERLSVEQEIAKVRRALGASRSITEMKALREQLRGLQKQQSSLVQDVAREEKFRDSILDSLDEEQRKRKQLQQELIKNQKAANAEELKERILAEQIIALEKKRASFDIKSITKAKSVEDINSNLLDQVTVFNKLIDLQDKLGISDKDRGSLTKEIESIHEIAKASSVQLQVKDAQTQDRLNSEKFQEDAVRLDKKSQKDFGKPLKDIEFLNKIALVLAQEIKKLGTEDQTKLFGITQLSNDQAFLEGRDSLARAGDPQKKLINTLVSLPNALKVAVFQQDTVGIDRLSKELAEQISAQQRRLGGKGALEDDNLQEINSLLGKVLLSIRTPLEQLQDEISRLEKSEARRLQAPVAAGAAIGREMKPRTGVTPELEAARKRLAVFKEREEAGFAPKRKSLGQAAVAVSQHRDLLDALRAQLKKNEEISKRGIKDPEAEKEETTVELLTRMLAEAEAAPQKNADAIANIKRDSIGLTEDPDQLDILSKVETEAITKAVAEGGLSGGIEVAKKLAGASDHLTAQFSQVMKDFDLELLSDTDLKSLVKALQEGGVKAAEILRAKLAEAGTDFEKARKAEKDKQATDAADPKLREQAKRQKQLKDLRLTGIAQRVASSDIGVGTSVFASRKRAAEERRDQQRRNEKFLRDRQAAKKQKVEGPGTKQQGFSNEFNQIAAQLQKASKDTSPEGKKETERLQHALQVLGSISDRGGQAQAERKLAEEKAKIAKPSSGLLLGDIANRGGEAEAKKLLEAEKGKEAFPGDLLKPFPNKVFSPDELAALQENNDLHTRMKVVFDSFLNGLTLHGLSFKPQIFPQEKSTPEMPQLEDREQDYTLLQPIVNIADGFLNLNKVEAGVTVIQNRNKRTGASR